MRLIILASLFLLLIGCSNLQNSSESDLTDEVDLLEAVPEISLESEQAGEEIEAKAEVEVDVEVEDITIEDFVAPAGFVLQREHKHIDTDASYFLYEFEVSNSLQEIDNWIRSESTRLGGRLIERYSYDIESDSRIDLIIETSSKVGTRIFSTYTQQYMDKQYLFIEVTLLKKPIDIDQNYEDHALVIYTPLQDGTTKETFKGMYAHQHTDIFSYYFYTNAFFEELIETNVEDKLATNLTYEDLDYVIGYFDKQGKEYDPYTITDEELNELIFGINLRTDFLPKEAKVREAVLFHWAKTVLIGDKAYSRVFDGTEQVNFLLQGKMYRSFTLQELLS